MQKVNRENEGEREAGEESGGTTSTSDADDGFLAREISDVDESVVERGVDVGNAEDHLAGADVLGTEGLLLLGSLDRLLSLQKMSIEMEARGGTEN